MRPPPYPTVHGVPVQLRPKFMSQCQVRPPRKLAVFRTKENRTSMMKQCCQRGHHKTPYCASYKSMEAAIEELLKRHPNIDRMMAETLLKLHERGKLEQFHARLDEKPPLLV